MDDSIRLPTGHRIGLDGLLGLIPGLGDALGALVSSYFVLVAMRIGAPLPVVLRMGANVLVESVVGAIPLVGDLFDLCFKANVRNYRLLERYLENPQRSRRRSAALLAVALLGLIVLLVLSVMIAAAAVAAIWKVFTGP